MTKGSTESKRMMVHSYRGEDYLSTETFPSIVECKRVLRSRGYAFRNERTASLGDRSEILENGDNWVEVEEMRDEDKWLSLEGRIYVPLTEWAKKHDMTERKVRYAFVKGRLPGLKVGRKNFLYLEEEK